MAPDIHITKTSAEPGAASLSVTVPPESVHAAEEQATRAWQARVRLPGFRKGKAPAAVVKKKFAEDIRQQVLEDLVRQSWSRALEQESLQPIAEPHIHNLKWEPGQEAPLTFEFHVELKPDLKLGRLGGFTLRRTVHAVTDQQVGAQLEELREQRAPWTPVAGEKPKAKDLVHVTIATREGGGGGRRRRTRSRIKSCWARAGRFPTWRNASWACCRAKRWTPRSASPTTFPRRRSGGRPATSASRCRK